MKNIYYKGITMIELVIILGILAVLFAVTLPQFTKFRENQVLRSAVVETLSAVDKARAETLSSLNSSEYGVHFQSDSVIIFKGQTFSAGTATNEIISIVAPASITNATLGGVSGTSGDTYFSRLSAAPSKTGTVTITAGGSTKTITISATGQASAN
jgi:Tfp pilus assembly protein FimT